MKEKGSLFWTMIKLLIVAYVVTGVILMALALMLWKGNPPTELISGGILFAYVISCFTGGFVIGKKMGRMKYLWGLLFGAVYFVIIFALSMCLNGFAGEGISNAVTVFLLCISGGMLGGMLG